MHIPFEIWMRIAHYLPDEDLQAAFRVNKALFRISMDYRWGDVVVDAQDLVWTIYVLKRLSDPFVARRVKSFSLHFSLEAAKDIRPKHHVWLERFRASLKFAFHSTQKPTFSGFLSKLIACVPNFTNVVALTLDSWDYTPTHDLDPLYRSFWVTFGSKLERLAFGGNLESYAKIIKSKPAFSAALTSLQISFTENILRESIDPLADSRRLREVIAPFIGSFHSLSTLKITPWTRSLDLSPIFKVCNSFPHLTHLVIRTSFDRALHDPSGLEKLLWNTASTLEGLELRLNPSQAHMNIELEEQLCRWLLECLQNKQYLAQIEELDLYPTKTTNGLEVILRSVRRSSTTLRRLIIRDRYNSEDDFLPIMEALSECPRLRYLRISIQCFNIQVLDCIAERLPNLDCLWISLGNRTDMGGGIVTELGERSYNKWKLRDLSLWQSGAAVSKEIMFQFGESIPSLESFFENKHINIHHKWT